MLRTFCVFIVILNYYFIESVSIEYPSNKHIEERIRKNFDSIDQIFRYYIVSREIQFHTDAVKAGLPYLLRCKGSQNSINFTVPISAEKYLSLAKDDQTHTITAKLQKNQLSINLVGRYTCSEVINDEIHETTVHVFIQDETSVFTQKVYPKIIKHTGVHFFNIPCQTTTWYAKTLCPTLTDWTKCKLPECNQTDRQINELKCNLPICDGQEQCIPVSYSPSNVKSDKVFFDPQIGFALENPVLPKELTEFTCLSTYTPSKQVKIPMDSSAAEYVEIQQSSLSVMSDETLQLTCEIQYGTKIDKKIPTLFWFEEIYNLNLISNHTGKPVFNLKTQVFNRNSLITLRGFKPNNVYRFYCVRVSDRGLYSRSIDITCVNTPLLDVEIDTSESNTDNKFSYGSNAAYDISIFTIPRSSIEIELSRDGNLLTNDKRFEISLTNNRENQYFEYTFTIYNVTFEDEADLKITVRSSMLKKTTIIKPKIIGDPVAQVSFVSEETPPSIPWRDENNLNIYSYGFSNNKSYNAVCTVRHRSDVKRPLNVFIQYYQCSVDDCLLDLMNKVCQTSSNRGLRKSISTSISNYQSSFINNASYELNNPSTGYQYLCCYRQNGLITLAKGITVLSRNRNMFHVKKPEFGLVTGDILIYSCEGHELIYGNLQMIYNDGLMTYERNYFDSAWHVKGTNQIKNINIGWNSTRNEQSRSMIIEVKTSKLTMIDNNKYFQCFAISKHSNIAANAKDTYIINLDDPIPLQFQTNLQNVTRLDQRSGDNVEFDCKFNGRPVPKILWFKGKLPLNNQDSTLKFGKNNESISITRLQASDTGYYTCELDNGHNILLRRSFDLRVQGTSQYSQFGRLAGVFILVSILILLIMLILLIKLAMKYFQMKRDVDESIFRRRISTGTQDESKLQITQLTHIGLPDNFASTEQIRTFLSYVNGENVPSANDNFKELGRGRYGVVYQVRLPEIGLVAAKTLPETIRRSNRTRNKRKKSHDIDENEQMLSNHEAEKQKAAEMLIDEIKIMNRAGKHINIVALKKVAYPAAKFKLLFFGGPIRDEDSFYLMELCPNGSLESVLKSFLTTSSNSSQRKLSLYETLSKQTGQGMTVQQALEQCNLTENDLKLVAYQVACGLDYLNRRQIAHCDIAARNVLVSSRFTMKICDFGLAAWTTYKNYSEQLAERESVQLTRKRDEIATHNLTPELAKALLRASTPDERLLLNKTSIKCDVWSFGIFLWTLFLKCRVLPFNDLLQEVKQKSDGESFFRRLAQIISEGRIHQYINYQPDIPRNIYAIIRQCLLEENERPDMTTIRAFLCHSKVLSKQAFEYYRSEYNGYQEENAVDDNVEYFGENQGISELPSFQSDHATNNRHDNVVKFRPTPKDNGDHSTANESHENRESYLAPVNVNTQPQINNNTNNSEKVILQPNMPQINVQIRGPTRPAPPPPILSKKQNRPDDSSA